MSLAAGLSNSAGKTPLYLPQSQLFPQLHSLPLFIGQFLPVVLQFGLSAIHRGASKKRGSHGRIDPRLPRWSSIKNIRVHSFMAVVFLLWLVIVGFEIYPSLSSR